MRRALGAIALCLALAGGSTASAQRDDAETGAGAVAIEQERTERARFLYNEGVACTDAADWPCAERTFREILGLRDAPAVRYSLALALSELDRFPESERLLRTVLNDPDADGPLREQARTLRGQLREAAAQLWVELTAGAVGLSVRIDDDEIPPEQLADLVLVAPGRRVVTANRGDEELARESVEAVAGESISVELAVPLDGPLDETGDEGPADVPEWVIFAGAAAGGVVLIITIAIAIAATSSGRQPPLAGDFEPGVLVWD